MSLKAASAIVLAGAVATIAVAADTDPLPREGAPPTRSTPRGGRAPRLLARAPFLGVACRVANSIRCDQVGLAVWLRRHAERVHAVIAGRRLRMEGHEVGRPSRYFVAYLHHAGLADGPLRVPFTVRGRWYGENAPRVRVRVIASGRSVVVRAPLHAGWG